MSLSARIRGVIVDLDGTLVDTRAAVITAIRHALASIGIRNTDDGDIVDHFGQGTAQMIKAFASRAGVPLSDEKKAHLVRKKNRIQAGLSDRTILFPNVPVFLATLRTRSFRLALASMSARIVVSRVLKHHRISHFFDAVVTYEDVRSSKPDPEILQVAARRLALPLKECCFIGDSRHDSEAASRAGIQFILVDSGCYEVSPERRGAIRKEAAFAVEADELLAIVDWLAPMNTV